MGKEIPYDQEGEILEQLSGRSSGGKNTSLFSDRTWSVCEWDYMVSTTEIEEDQM